MQKLEWIVTFSPPKIQIVKSKNDRNESVFVERAWGAVIFNDENSLERNFTFFSGSSTDLSANDSDVSSVIFAQKPFQTITLKLSDGQVLGINNLSLVNFYAATDIGSLLVSYCPHLMDVTRPLIVTFNENRKNIPLMHHLAAQWLVDIFKSE